MDQKIKPKPNRSATIIYGDVIEDSKVSEQVDRMLVHEMIRNQRPIPPLIVPEEKPKECDPEDPKPTTD